MRHCVPVALIALLLSFIPQRSAHAWGFTGHRLIMGRAIALLPAELRPYFEKNRVALVEHSTDPDTYRSVGFTEEEPRHFVDMDTWGGFPFTAIPHDYNAAVAARGQEFVLKNGTLPWRLQEIYGKLADAFRQLQTNQYSRDNIKLFSSVLAHYMSDATQPFHATANYDGQLSGQSGIHSRFEADMIERFQDRLTLTPAPIVPIANPRDFAFQTLGDSFQFVKPVLDADRAAVAGKDVYDDGYYAMMLEKTQPILEKRLSVAITDVASLIAAAWKAGGSPALPPDTPPRPPRKVRR